MYIILSLEIARRPRLTIAYQGFADRVEVDEIRVIV